MIAERLENWFQEVDKDSNIHCLTDAQEMEFRKCIAEVKSVEKWLNQYMLYSNDKLPGQEVTIEKTNGLFPDEVPK
jgi:hypothetical protein